MHVRVSCVPSAIMRWSRRLPVLRTVGVADRCLAFFAVVAAAAVAPALDLHGGSLVPHRIDVVGFSYPYALHSTSLTGSQRCRTRLRALTPGEAAARYAAEAQSFEKPRRGVDRADVDLRFSRSGGPGGQNVNKLETKVDLFFDVGMADFLPEWVKENLRKQEKNRFNSAGILTFSSSEQRTQGDNIRIAMQKLQDMIDKASYIPPPPDKSKKKKMDAKKKEYDKRRIEDKRLKSMRKNKKRDMGW